MRRDTKCLSVFSPNEGKYGPEKTPNTGTFHAVFIDNTEDIKYINPFYPCVAFHIETSQLSCSANQMTGFYMKCNNRQNPF